MVDLLRVQANERVDLIDFQYLAKDVLENVLRDQGRGFQINPNGSVTAWILSGFGMSDPLSNKQLVVTKGRALLGYRLGGSTNFGMLTIDGDASKTIDMTSLTPGTYNVYVRFEYVDTDSTTRAFWDPAGTGQEFTQTIPTRLQANWSLRVETSSPGAEWTKIGTADNNTAPLTLVDMRKFYFEGAVDSTYASGWSTDGGGGANDRNANRLAYGITDLQSFTAATRQCLEDIKGRGLRRWWSRDIGGMNLGFDANPVEGRLALGDVDCFVQGGTSPVFTADSGGDDFFYERSTNRWFTRISSAEVIRTTSNGVSIAKGLFVGFLGDNPVDDALSVRDSNFVIQGSLNTPKFVFDNFGGLQDEFQYDRSANQYKWLIANVERLRLGIAGLAINNGLYVGNTIGVPTDNNIYAEGQIEALLGIKGTGTLGSGSGVYGVGGLTNGIGVEGLGTGTGAGVRGTSGSGVGAGVHGVGGAAGSIGVYGNAGAGSIGVYGSDNGNTNNFAGSFSGATSTSGPAICKWSITAPVSQEQLVSRNAQNAVLACAHVDAAGVISVTHWNIASITHPGVGVFVVTLDQAVNWNLGFPPGQPAITVSTPCTFLPGVSEPTFASHIINSTTQITVYLYQAVKAGGFITGFTPVDKGFTIIVVGASLTIWP